jgi:hypothetical protein
MLDLKRIDGLLDVRRRPLDLDRVPDLDGPIGQTNRSDTDVAVVVEDLTDLPSFHRVAHALCAI